jgi:hypothetical protein
MIIFGPSIVDIDYKVLNNVHNSFMMEGILESQVHPMAIIHFAHCLSFMIIT